MVRSARAARVRTVAVLPFVFLNRPLSAGPVVVSERLTSRMSGSRGLELVERELIGRLLNEKRLALTGALDAATSGKVGQLLNVDAVVSGTLVSLGEGRVEVNARLVRAKDGEILAGASARIRQDWQESSGALGPADAAGSAPPIDLSMVSIPQALFSQRCAPCHGPDGSGHGAAPRVALKGSPGPSGPGGAAAPDLARAAVQSKSDEQLKLQIEAGGGRMPAYGDPTGAMQRLSDEEVDALVRLVRGLGRGRKEREAAVALGNRLFDRNCAACHGYDGHGSHLAAGLFDVPIERLDMARNGAASLDSEQLAAVLKRNKRKMLFKGEMSAEVMARLWLYLQRLARLP